MKALYFDCFAGASGNMILAGLVELGVDPNALAAELKKLNIADFELDVTRVDRSGISSTHIDVKVPDENSHRHLHHIEKIITESGLSDGVKERAIAIFTRLAEAEAKIHGTDIKKVHFHEVGAMDAIIDITGTCIALEMLGVERFMASRLHVGSGFVNMAHGKYPIPPPAVAELIKGVPFYSTDVEGELLTPTGAAIITTLCESFGPAELVTERTGYGAGTREYKDFPNVIRLFLGTAENVVKDSGTNKEKLLLFETNIDDASPQTLGYVMDRAFSIGAVDCWFTPIQMKKNRPATMLSILAPFEKRSVIMELIFRETPSIGVRVTETARESLSRETRPIETSFGSVDVKIAYYNGEPVNVMPEFDQLRQIAEANNISLQWLRDEVLLKCDRMNASEKGAA